MMDCIDPRRRFRRFRRFVMCGIVAYVGRKLAQPLLIEGLKRLEYRGYDSAGIAVIDDGAGCTSAGRSGGSACWKSI